MQRGSATRSGGRAKGLGHGRGLTRPTTSRRRSQDMDRSATPPSRSRQWKSAASSPVRSPARSAPPEIRPCAPGALPSGRVESPRRGAGGGTVVCICTHAQDSQPGDQGGCGHSTALSASPSTTCSARAVTALWQCRSSIPLFWPDGCCHELGGDGTWLPEGLSHSSRPPPFARVVGAGRLSPLDPFEPFPATPADRRCGPEAVIRASCWSCWRPDHLAPRAASWP
jgi:hypothetical protein